MRQSGETLARDIGLYIHAPVATTVALAAIPAYHRADNMMCVVAADHSTWIFDGDATATESTDIVAPGSGSGRWKRAGGGSGTGGGKLMNVTSRSSGALAAYTRTANVILADAVGALGAQDGVTHIVGETFFLHPDDAAAGADAGPYVIDVIGAVGTKYQMTRVAGADTSADFPGLVITVEEGTTYKDTAFQVTNDSITLNTTAITAQQVPFGFGAVGAMAAVGTTGAASAGTAILAAPIDHDHAFSLTSSVVGSRPAASAAGLLHDTTDTAAGLYRDGGASWVQVAPRLQKRSVTITSADLTTAGVGPETENIGAVLPQTAIIIGYRLNLTDAFDNGAGVSLTVEVGTSNDVDALEDAFDAFTGSAYEGAGFVYVTPGPGIGTNGYDGTAVGQLVATFTAGADQLANFTDGSLTVEVLFLDLA